MTNTTQTTPFLKNFCFDTKDVDWKDFITTGCYYKLLDVNVATQTADMLVKFEPGARCMYHRHVAPATSLVLGESYTSLIRPAPARRSEVSNQPARIAVESKMMCMLKGEERTA